MLALVWFIPKKNLEIRQKKRQLYHKKLQTMQNTYEILAFDKEHN